MSLRLRITYSRSADFLVDVEQQVSRRGLLVRVDVGAVERGASVELEIVTPAGRAMIKASVLQPLPGSGVAVELDPAAFQPLIDAVTRAPATTGTESPPPRHERLPDGPPVARTRTPSTPIGGSPPLARTRTSSTPVAGSPIVGDPLRARTATPTSGMHPIETTRGAPSSDSERRRAASTAPSGSSSMDSESAELRRARSLSIESERARASSTAPPSTDSERRRAALLASPSTDFERARASSSPPSIESERTRTASSPPSAESERTRTASSPPTTDSERRRAGLAPSTDSERARASSTAPPTITNISSEPPRPRTASGSSIALPRTATAGEAAKVSAAIATARTSAASSPPATTGSRASEAARVSAAIEASRSGESPEPITNPFPDPFADPSDPQAGLPPEIRIRAGSDPGTGSRRAGTEPGTLPPGARRAGTEPGAPTGRGPEASALGTLPPGRVRVPTQPNASAIGTLPPGRARAGTVPGVGEAGELDDGGDDDDDPGGVRRPVVSDAALFAQQQAQKIQLALHGDKNQRATLLRDPNRLFHGYVLKNPQLQLDEVVFIAKLATVSAETLTFIASRREWAERSEIAVAIVRNPKTPVLLAIRMLDHCSEGDVRTLAKQQSVREQIQRAARKKILG
ncbi:MAG: hypothetical protein ABI867_21745 [Kofleriaceae bacterium]